MRVGSLMETGRFPLFRVSLAGFRPGGRLTSLRRQRSKQERRPRFTGPWLKLRLIQGLPCAARIGRPAQNSPAARAQTTAPEGPARCCAARRLRGASRDLRAFTNPAAEPSLFKAWVSPRFGYNDTFSKGSVLDKSPFRTAEQRRARRSSPGRLSERAKPASSAPADDGQAQATHDPVGTRVGGWSGE